MAQIIPFNDSVKPPKRSKRAKSTVQDVNTMLRQCRGQMKACLVIGWTPEGEFFFDASNLDISQCIFMVESFKHGMFNNMLDEGDEE